MRRFVEAWMVWGIACGVVCVALAGASEAHAWERTKTCGTFGAPACRAGETPRPLQWPMRCVEYLVHEKGSDAFARKSDGTIGEKPLSLVQKSFDVWNEAAAGCGDFEMVFGGLTETSEAAFDREAGYEGNENILAWRDDSWPYSGSNFAFSLTSVSYDADTGNIQDADIEINTATYEFENLQQSRVDEREPPVDLRNALTHEVGHFLGLAHSETEEATMYGNAPRGEIAKRTLHSDDIDGICATYPSEAAASDCDDPSDFRPPEMDAGTTGGDAGDVGPDVGSVDGAVDGANEDAAATSDGCIGPCSSAGPTGLAQGLLDLVILLIAVAVPRRLFSVRS